MRKQGAGWIDVHCPWWDAWPEQEAARLGPALCYEDMLQEQRPRLPGFRWARMEEDDACGLCYTSGTTGRPKVGGAPPEPCRACSCCWCGQHAHSPASPSVEMRPSHTSLGWRDMRSRPAAAQRAGSVL